MAKSRNRASRTVVGVLVLTILLGLLVYLRQISTDPDAPQAQTGTPVGVEAVQATPATPPARIELAQGEAVQTQTPAPPSKNSDGEGASERQNDSSEARATPAAAKESGGKKKQPPATTRKTAGNAKQALSEGRRLMEAGQLLAARQTLNDALPHLSAVELDAAKTMLAEINQTVVFSSRRFADDPFGGTYSVKPGDVLAKIAARHDVTWELLGRINNLSDPRRLRAGATIKVIKGPFHAVVTKSQFRLDLYLGAPGGPGSLYVRSFPVGLGKDGSTPTGAWVVNDTKQKNPKFWGAADLPPMEADDPNNPLGEHWVGLVGTDGEAVGAEGYGIHGTIDPDSIGKQASLGCIRLRNDDVALVYEALIEGKSTVVVKD